MPKFSALVFAAAVASAASAVPAFAQAFDPDAGSGNIVPFNVAPVAQQDQHAVARRSGRDRIVARAAGLHVFAMVPGGAAGQAAASTYDPALTGGGSLGYNQNLANY